MLINKKNNFKLAVKYYKKHIIIAVLATMLLLCSLAFCAGTWQDAGGMTKAAVGAVDNICNMDSLDNVTKMVLITFDDKSLNIAGTTIDVTKLISSVNELCVGIAFCILVLTFFVSFMRIRDQEINMTKFIIKLGLLVACMALIFKAQEICLNIANLGTGIAMKVSDAANSSFDTTVVNDIKQLVYDQCKASNDGLLGGLWENLAAIGIYLQLLVPSLSMWIVSVIINVTCWSRAFEIIILSSFSPLAFADATGIDNFGQGSGSRFIKNIIALSISGAIIIFIMALCSTVSLSVLRGALGTTDPTTGVFTAGSFDGFISGTKDIVVIGFAQVGLVLKAQSIAKTICGVG